MFKKGKPYRVKIIDFTFCMGSIPGMVLGMHGINMYEDSMEVKIWRVAYPTVVSFYKYDSTGYIYHRRYYGRVFCP